MAGINHANTMVIPDDPGVETGTDEWNADHTITGDVNWGGFAIDNLSYVGTKFLEIPQAAGNEFINAGSSNYPEDFAIISGGAATPDAFGTLVRIFPESGNSDILDTLLAGDDDTIVMLLADTGTNITVTHNFGTDGFRLRHKIPILLSARVPLVLLRSNSKWNEISGPEVTKVQIPLGIPSSTLATGDNQANHIVDMAGRLIKVKANVDTVSSSGTPTFALRKNSTDMLATDITIDENETSSESAATPAVINSDGSEDVEADDVIRIDVDVAGTGTLGAILTLWLENLELNA